MNSHPTRQRGAVRRGSVADGSASRWPGKVVAGWASGWPGKVVAGSAGRAVAGLALLGGTALLLAACGASGTTAAPGATVTVTVKAGGGGGSGGGGAPGSNPSPTATAPADPPGSTPADPPSSPPADPPSSAPAGPPTCLASALKVSLNGTEGAAGSTDLNIVLTNASAHTCSLFGFPGVSFVSRPGGRQIGAAAVRSRALAPVRAVLESGDDAHLSLAVGQAANFPAGKCHPITTNWLRIYPPGDFGSVYLRYPSQACARTSAQLLTVTPVRSGAGSDS